MPATDTQQINRLREPAEDDYLLPGMPEDFVRRPAPTEYKKLAEPLAEIAPGIWGCGQPEWEMPTHVVCKLIPGKIAGTWTLEPEVAPGWVRMADDIGDRLGIRGLSHMTLRRLMQAGFVEHARPAPGTIFIHLESLHQHFRNTRNDCGEPSSFWTETRRLAWRETCGSPSNLKD